MPLGDHFHSPWMDENPWESFHSAWINTIVRQLNGSILPRRYRAMPQVHLGALVEADVAAFEADSSAEGESGAGGALATALWSPPAPAQTLLIDWPNQDVFEARVYDDARGMQLVAAIELVSPRNKDRLESRRAFVSKCAAHLQEQVGVLVVDVVTNRANLHQELLELLSRRQSGEEFPGPPPHAFSYRTGKQNGAWHWDLWPVSLDVGHPLPVMPLWLASDFSVPVDLEKSYEETRHVLRIQN